MRFLEHVNRGTVTCGLLLGLIVAALGVWAQSGAKLLFKSGFESNVTLGPVTGNAPGSIYQTIGGTDLSTGFSWPFTPYNPSPSTEGFHLIPWSGSSDALANHFHNAIDTTQAHSGSSSLLLSLDGYPEGSCCAQEVFQIGTVSQPITSWYQRIWIKLQPDLQTQIQTYKGSFWRVLWEYKTPNDYRIVTYIYGDSSGNAYWFAHADNNPNNTCPPSGVCSNFWSISNHSVPVPFNQWFLLEVYMKRSSGSDGRFFWAINGQTVADHMGPSYGANNEGTSWLGFENIYSNYFPMYEWVDDLEVWDNPPCANLPCGQTTSGQSPSPPTNLTATVH